MQLVFKARVLLELGAELISSDAVALYELIKNGVDAGSPKIIIEIRIAMQPSSARSLQDYLAKISDKQWDVLKFLSVVEEHLEETASDEHKEAFIQRIGSPASSADALVSLKDALFAENHIVVTDHGRGMTVADIKNRYLVVGTPARLHERATLISRGDEAGSTQRLPLGEKGIGRFAAVRIGHHIHVETGVVDQKCWNEVTMDWRPVFEDPDLDVTELDFRPKRSNKAKDESSSGTKIIIQDLQSDWFIEKIRELSETDLAKIADPFQRNFANKFIRIHYQGEQQSYISGFQKSLLKHADAVCEITYRSSSSLEAHDGCMLHVRTNHLLYDKEEVNVYAGAHLMECVSHPPRKLRRKKGAERLPNSDEVVAALQTVGDFSAKFYWFNRGRIMRDAHDLWEASLRNFVRGWSGGLLVYRDGFRVYPYGSQADDWLDLDRKALASSAFKLNRAQIVGYLRISTRKNSRLQDQTNREGFRDCPEKEALRRMLRQAIIADCRVFLEKCDKTIRKADEETIRDIDDRIVHNQQFAVESLKALRIRVPDERLAISEVLEQLAEVEDAWSRAKDALAAHKQEVDHYLHLAGVGLMVEVIAHEMARATDAALALLASGHVVEDPAKLDSLEAQLKTLNKRVRVLDSLSIPGRQRRVTQSLREIIETVLEMYAPKLERHGVAVSFRHSGTLRRKVEKGQIIGILDNLMSNSIYWLVRRIELGKPPQITIELDEKQGLIRFSDNGPGIPTVTGEKVFEAYYTTKPSRDGRGLGLFIARRLAEENRASLELIPTKGQCHEGFIVVFDQEQ